jgi:nicotinamidase-related amidase
MNQNKKRVRLTILIQICILFVITSCNEDKVKTLSSANALRSIYIENFSEVYTNINSTEKTVEILIPFNSSLTIDKIKLKILISEKATVNVDPEVEYDLSEPFIIEIIAEDNSSAEYTINAKKCEGGKAAVIVSDTQNDIIPLYRQDEFFLNTNKVLDKANSAEVPIYYVMLKSLKGSSDWDLPEQLHYYDNGAIVDKDDIFDAFDGTILHKELLLKGISKVYVVGVSSMGCVRGTCTGAISRKYDLVLVSDAHAEPIGYREESAIDQCNELFQSVEGCELILANDVIF